MVAFFILLWKDYVRHPFICPAVAEHTFLPPLGVVFLRFFRLLSFRIPPKLSAYAERLFPCLYAQPPFSPLAMARGLFGLPATFSGNFPFVLRRFQQHPCFATFLLASIFLRLRLHIRPFSDFFFGPTIMFWYPPKFPELLTEYDFVHPDLLHLILCFFCAVLSCGPFRFTLMRTLLAVILTFPN